MKYAFISERGHELRLDLPYLLLEGGPAIGAFGEEEVVLDLRLSAGWAHNELLPGFEADDDDIGLGESGVLAHEVLYGGDLPGNEFIAGFQRAHIGHDRLHLLLALCAIVFVGEDDLRGIAVFGTGSEVSIKGGEIIASGYTIAGNGNGQNNGTTINIEGGTLTSENDVSIYHPQDGVMTVSGGTITGQDGIQMVGGELNITGGTIRAIGEYRETYEKDDDGSILGGAALSILSRADYVGRLVVNISGTPTLESKNGNAIAEATVNNDKNEDHFEKLTIAGGTFTGAANQAAIATYFAKPGDITITAGTFSSHIKDIFPDYPDAFSNIEIAEDNGKFYVVIHSESISLPATKEMTVGTSERLEVTFTPENTTETTLTWSSSDGSIVTVDGNGIVTAVSVGTADITATAENGKTATCSVTVIAGAPQHSSGGGGGCSAGFGALALLAAVPLMFRRKK